MRADQSTTSEVWTARIDGKTTARLLAKAAELGLSRAQIIRAAIVAYVEGQQA